MSELYDVAIVGAGTAGLAALREVQKHTDHFVLINDGPWGTTCARVGCMPSKALIEAAAAFHRRTTFESFGIRGAEHLEVDVPRVLARVRRLRDGFVGGVLKATEGLGARAISGRARFEGPNELSVNGQRLRAKAIIIATGSRPDVPDAWQTLGDRLLTSDTIFEQDDLPSRIGVIGLGPIGAELGQALARLGIEVAAFDMKTTVGGLSDPEINEVAIEYFRSEFDIQLGVAAQTERVDDGVRISAGDTTRVVDQVLVAIGRRPNIDHLGLDRLGVQLDQRGMPPFDASTLQVADLPVFIAGDVNGRAPILHEAADDGHIAGRNAVASHLDCYVRRTPLAIVFTDPDLAVVGSRFESLDANDTVIGEVRFERHGRARTAEKNRGALRLYAQQESGRLLGSELCVPDGEHLAHLLALAVQQNLTAHDLLGMPFYHPVLEEGLRTALRRIEKQRPSSSPSDLAACDALGAEALDGTNWPPPPR